MLVSESKKFVFVHVQKTAGTSLTRLLAPHALAPSASRWNKLASDLNLRRDWRRFHFRKHAPLQRAQQVLPAAVYAGAFKFAFVRNPWDRLVSWYRYIHESPGHHRHQRVSRLSGFDAFVDEFTASARRSQWAMVENSTGECGLDWVGRFETLADDTRELCRRLDIPAEHLPHDNKSTRRDYRSYFSDASAELVARRWAREIAYFGYAFDDKGAG